MVKHDKTPFVGAFFLRHQLNCPVFEPPKYIKIRCCSQGADLKVALRLRKDRSLQKASIEFFQLFHLFYCQEIVEFCEFCAFWGPSDCQIVDWRACLSRYQNVKTLQ